RNNLKKMLEKYGGNYDGNDDTIYQKYEEYVPDKKQNESSFGIDNIEDGFFVGIKLYPPLGFDPWPDESDETWEFKKVNYLYQFCCWKGIPITVHCGGIGFQVINNDLDEKYTNPDKQWRKVLKHYPNLKINFAHMGLRRNYTPTIFEFMKRYANIYTDFSGMALSRKSYKKIISTINAENFSDEQRSRILFGTDFMINLLWIDSLKDYLEEFFKSDLPEKNSYCSTNPEKFLFGRNNKTEKCNPFPIDENGEENTLCSQYHCEKYPG
ncbi:MAG: amidohydrolase family protein, partial [Deltaproteobacteria bacterium]|nr:amidohydrolase family protein [Deltaproteobacteria bacterium]